MKEEVREMKDTQYSFNRNLRKIIQRRGGKTIQENSPDPKKDTGLHTAWANQVPKRMKKKEQIARHVLVELQTFQDIKKILRAL